MSDVREYGSNDVNDDGGDVMIGMSFFDSTCIENVVSSHHASDATHSLHPSEYLITSFNYRIS